MTGDTAEALGRDAGTFVPGDLLSFLLKRGLIGLVWANGDLRVLGTAGRLADWVEPGQHVCADLFPFHGLDDDIHELKDDFRPSLVLPKVGLDIGGNNVEKTSIEIFWIEAQASYVIVLHQLGAQPEFEAELTRQMRARRLAEQNLAAMQREMRLTQGMVETIVESAPAALAIFDTDMRYLLATHQWLELFALEADAIAGNRHGDLASADTAALEGGLGRALEGHVVDDDLQQVGRRADGEAGWLALRHAPWRDARGRIAGAVSTARPATAEVRERQETAREVDELRRVNRDLESFAALVAHDIRAPLSAIQRKMSTLDNSDTDDATTLSGIGETLQRALDIVDGVLEFTTAGGSAGPAHALDVEGLVRRIAGETTRGTPFTYEVSGTWPMLTTAVAPLDLALRNLMQNTVKHHDLPQGRIHVSVADAGKHWHFDIADDGPGIPVAQHDAIFEPLVTAGDDTQARSTGLGLAFVRRAAESVGGQIRVMSDPDVHRGTTFRIVWPK